MIDQCQVHPTYAFSYGVKDLHTGDVKSQWESRDEGIVKGHYSVLEPDGSIRSVHYSADSKNGFQVKIKTHGANSHPIYDEHGHIVDENDITSQSKINHYSKDQEHILLSSDLHPHKKPVIDLNQNEQQVPSLFEINPKVEKWGVEHDGWHKNLPQMHHSPPPHHPLRYEFDDHREHFDDRRQHFDERREHFNYGEEYNPSFESRASIRAVKPPHLHREHDRERDIETFMTDESRTKEYANEELAEEVYPRFVKPHAHKKEVEGTIYGQAKPNHFKISPGYWPKWYGRSLRPTRNEFATIQMRPGKLSPGKTVAVFTDDEAERRTASARMAQSLLARTKNAAFPVYAHRNVNYS